MLTKLAHSDALETCLLMDEQSDFMNPAQIHLQVAKKYEDSARNWKDVSRRLFNTDPSLSAFAHRCAIDNELLASQERVEAKRLMEVAA